MTARDWIALGALVVGIATLINVWALFLLRRLLRSVDRHGEQIDVINAKLPTYVLRDLHDVANAQLAAHMERMRLEGQAREARILDAIDRASASQTSENRMLRSELGQVHSRIDRLQEQSPRRL